MGSEKRGRNKTELCHLHHLGGAEKSFVKPEEVNFSNSLWGSEPKGDEVLPMGDIRDTQYKDTGERKDLDHWGKLQLGVASEMRNG